MYATFEDTVLASTVTPSGRAFAANQLVPSTLPPPGMLRIRMVGAPTMCFSRNGARNRFRMSVAPPTALGTTSSIVFPA